MHGYLCVSQAMLVQGTIKCCMPVLRNDGGDMTVLMSTMCCMGMQAAGGQTMAGGSGWEGEARSTASISSLRTMASP